MRHLASCSELFLDGVDQYLPLPEMLAVIGPSTTMDLSDVELADG